MKKTIDDYVDYAGGNYSCWRNSGRGCYKVI